MSENDCRRNKKDRYNTCLEVILANGYSKTGLEPVPDP